MRSRAMHGLLCVMLLVFGQATLKAAVLNVPADYATIQDAINAAAAGDTVRLDNASSPFVEGIITIPLSKTGLTIEGQGSMVSSTSPNFGLNILADNVIILDLTMDGAGTFGFITGDPANGGNGLQMTNCTAMNCGGTGFAMTGVDNLTLNQITSMDNGGNGMSLTSVQNVTITDFTSSGNTFGSFGAGIGIFSCDTYSPCDASSITITGTIDISENPEIYSQESVCGGTCSPGSVSAITLSPSNVTYEYFMGIGATQKFYYQNLADAYAAADLTLDANPGLRPLLFVEGVVDGNKYLSPRNVAAEDLSIQAAVDFASMGDTLYIESGTLVEGSQIIIDKDLTIIGSGKDSTTLRPGFNTGSGGDARGWILVNANTVFNLSHLTMNGMGNLVWQAIRQRGEGTVDSVLFTEIKYQEGGPAYQGTAIAAFGTGNVDVTNSMFTEIGRIGVLYFDPGISGSTFKNNMYTGKGDGDWLDYALDISAGAIVTVDSNIISDNRGVASVDGSNSAGVLVSTFFAPGTEASLVNNNISDCFFGLVVGFDAADASVVTARGNNFVGNRWGVFSNNPEVDAILNWWGDASGPDVLGPGTGDSVSANVLFCPWLTSPSNGSPVSLDPVIITCPPNVTVFCREELHPDFTGTPTATGPLTIGFAFADSVVTNPATTTFYTIYRTWIATNDCGAADTCVQVIEVEDLLGPTIQDCPGDIIVDLTDNQQCDTTLFWEAPMMGVDNCTFNDFLGFYHPAHWDLEYVGAGNGTNADTSWSADLDELQFVGTTNGNNGSNTIAQLCIDIPFDGEVTFSWEASNPGNLGGGDRPTYRVNNGAQVFMGNGGDSFATGRDTVTVDSADRFCYRVFSNDDADVTTLTINEFSFAPEVVITQVSGPLSDSAPGMGDGTSLTPGRYTVVYEAEDLSGNTSQCDFEIQVWGANELSCEDVNVSLDSQCMVVVNPGMFLTGTYVCLDAFEVEVRDPHGNVLSDTIGLDYLDQTLEYEVSDPGSGNRCWGTLTIEDKFAPEIVCRNDTMTCLEFAFNVNFPEVIEFCQDYDSLILDERIINEDCDAEFIRRVTRKLIAVDASGNVSDTCFQEVFIERFPLGDIQPPQRFVEIYCGAGFDTTDMGFPSPMATGRPVLETQGDKGPIMLPLWPIPNFDLCNVTVEFEDLNLSGTECTSRFVRTWRIRSLCDWNNPVTFQQTIDIIDNVGPVVEIGRDTMREKAGQRSCDALVYMPEAFVNDACNEVDRVDMVYPGGFSGSQNGGYIRLPVGVDTVVYRAFDECYNMSTDTVIVLVQDGVAPVAICDQNMVVTLDNDGIVSVEAAAFDDGSFDECEMGSLQVSRMDDPCGTGTNVFGDFVDFCCADVGQVVMVAFKAIDASGNENQCMVRVTVQDKQSPRVVGLPTIRVDCRFDWDTANLDVFGKFVYDFADRDSIIIDADFVQFIGQPLDGVVMDNCFPVIKEVVDMTNINQCGTGYIVRLFTFTDGQGNDATWSQSIFFDNPDAVEEADIDWPDHVDTVNVCGLENVRPEVLPEAQAFPRFMNDDECSLIGYTYKDEVIDASLGNEACFKIIRSWTVIDWCQTVNDTTKKWYFDQVIEVNNTIAPVFLNACTDTTISRIGNDCIGETIEIIGLANDDCTDSLDLFWRFKIDEGNDGTFERVGRGNDATHLFPFGENRVKLFVEDLCGNQDSCDFILTLENTKAPLAYCKPTVIAELTPFDTTTPPDGIYDIEEVMVNARIFDDGSSQACDNPLVFSYSTDPADSIRVYNCDSIGPNGSDTIKIVEIFVIDTVTGQFASCVDTLIIQDNNNANVCPVPTNLTGTVSGLIYSDRQGMIKDVMVELAQTNGMMDMSDDEGAYTFDGVGLGGRYEVIPSKNDDHLNGVSTADLVLIQRHLLGKTRLSTPYQYIAADVNNNNDVTAADIAELRRLILGVTSELPNNSSWRFVDRGYNFPEPKRSVGGGLPGDLSNCSL